MLIDRETYKEVRATFLYRGPEIAFLVPQGDLDALEDVMKKCTFWNGANSLIIPVSTAGTTPKWASLLLESHPVEAFLFHESVNKTARQKAQRRLGQGRSGNWWEFHEDFDRNELHPLLLQSQPPEGTALPSLFVPRPTTPRLRRISVASWGFIPPEDEPYYRRYFELGDASGADAPHAMVAGQLNSLAPSAQSVNLIQHYGPVGVGRHIHIFDQGTFSELVAFWNLRSRTDRYSDVPLYIGAPREVLSSAGALDLLAAHIRRDTFVDHTPDIGVSVAKKLHSKTATAFESAGFERDTSGRVRRRHLPQEDSDPSKDLSFAFFGPGVSGPFTRGAIAHDQITFHDGKASFSPPWPPAMPRTGHRVRVGIAGLPLLLPLTSSSSKDIHPGARCAPEGLLVDVETQTSSLELEIQDSITALASWAASSELQVVPSQAGRYGQALIDRLGSLEALDSLASKESLSILTALAPLSRLKLAQRIVSEAERSGETLSEKLLAEELRKDARFLDLRARHADEIGGETCMTKQRVLPHLSHLVQTGFVARGAHVRCPTCNFENVLGLAEQDEVVSCRACFQRFPLPVLDSGDEEATPVYRLDGLMARAMDQDLLPVLLTLRWLNADTIPPLVATWPGLEFSDKSLNTEVDLLTTNGDQVTIVECKSKAFLSPTDLDSLLQLAARLSARPAISALNGSFAKRVVDRVTDAGGIVLDRSSLLALPFG